MNPNLNEEKLLWQRGNKYVAGLDEAGRGPLAGPVVAAAVIISPKFKIKQIAQIKDSKKLSEKQREKFYDILTGHSQIKWGVGLVSEKTIDKINILEATKLAMQEALRQVHGKLNKKIEFLLIDGNFKIYCATPQRAIIKGDQKVISIAAASIIAKVTRDRIMRKFHKKYPKYGFDKHKGYGTEMHIKVLKKFGACAIHRKTFLKSVIHTLPFGI